MKCRHCGTKLPEGTRECNFCGARFDVEIDLGYKPPIDKTKRTKKFEKFFGIWMNLAAFLLVASIISGGFLSTYLGNTNFIFIAIGIAAFLGFLSVGFVFILFKLKAGDTRTRTKPPTNPNFEDDKKS